MDEHLKEWRASRKTKGYNTAKEPYGDWAHWVRDSMSIRMKKLTSFEEWFGVSRGGSKEPQQDPSMMFLLMTRGHFLLYAYYVDDLQVERRR